MKTPLKGTRLKPFLNQPFNSLKLRHTRLKPFVIQPFNKLKLKGTRLKPFLIQPFNNLKLRRLSSSNGSNTFSLLAPTPNLGEYHGSSPGGGGGEPAESAPRAELQHSQAAHVQKLRGKQRRAFGSFFFLLLGTRRRHASQMRRFISSSFSFFGGCGSGGGGGDGGGVYGVSHDARGAPNAPR